MTDWEIYLRIFVSACLGFVIGLDRSSKSKQAGVKTYMYVSMSCTLITIVSIYSLELHVTQDNRTLMDPMRLAAQIVTGLGSLGAGVILKNGLQVKGLTSAAMIFFVGGVGIGIGAGFYGIVLFSVTVGLLLAKVGKQLEKSNLFSDENSKDI